MISVSVHSAVVRASVPHRRFSASVSSEDRASSRVAVLTRGHCSERFCAGNLAQRRVWGKRAPSSSRAPSEHGAVPQASRSSARRSARRCVACHASSAPLLRTRARHTTWDAIPHCHDVRHDRRRAEWPTTKINCVQLVWITSAQNRAARFQSRFCRRRCEAPLRAAGNLRVAQVLHKLTEASPVRGAACITSGATLAPTLVGHAEKRRAKCRRATRGGVPSAWFAQTWPAHAPAAIVRHRMS
jgi:hypothetical protein